MRRALFSVLLGLSGTLAPLLTSPASAQTERQGFAAFVVDRKIPRAEARAAILAAPPANKRVICDWQRFGCAEADTDAALDQMNAWPDYGDPANLVQLKDRANTIRSFYLSYIASFGNADPPPGERQIQLSLLTDRTLVLAPNSSPLAMYQPTDGCFVDPGRTGPYTYAILPAPTTLRLLVAGDFGWNERAQQVFGAVLGNITHDGGAPPSTLSYEGQLRLSCKPTGERRSLPPVAISLSQCMATYGADRRDLPPCSGDPPPDPSRMPGRVTALDPATLPNPEPPQRPTPPLQSGAVPGSAPPPRPSPSQQSAAVPDPAPSPRPIPPQQSATVPDPAPSPRPSPPQQAGAVPELAPSPRPIPPQQSGLAPDPAPQPPQIQRPPISPPGRQARRAGTSLFAGWITAEEQAPEAASTTVLIQWLNRGSAPALSLAVAVRLHGDRASPNPARSGPLALGDAARRGTYDVLLVATAAIDNCQSLTLRGTLSVKGASIANQEITVDGALLACAGDEVFTMNVGSFELR